MNHIDPVDVSVARLRRASVAAAISLILYPSARPIPPRSIPGTQLNPPLLAVLIATSRSRV